MRLTFLATFYGCSQPDCVAGSLLLLETDLIDLINNGVVCSLQRDDIPQVEQDVVFLAQDWQAAVSDIQLVAEMEWFIVGYVTDNCLFLFFSRYVYTHRNVTKLFLKYILNMVISLDELRDTLT